LAARGVAEGKEPCRTCVWGRFYYNVSSDWARLLTGVEKRGGEQISRAVKKTFDASFWPCRSRKREDGMVADFWRKWLLSPAVPGGPKKKTFALGNFGQAGFSGRGGVKVLFLVLPWFRGCLWSWEEGGRGGIEVKKGPLICFGTVFRTPSHGGGPGRSIWGLAVYKWPLWLRGLGVKKPGSQFGRLLFQKGDRKGIMQKKTFGLPLRRQTKSDSGAAYAGMKIKRRGGFADPKGKLSSKERLSCVVMGALARLTAPGGRLKGHFQIAGKAGKRDKRNKVGGVFFRESSKSFSWG